MAKEQKVFAKGRYWTKEDIQDLIAKNDKAAIAALLKIYANQTDDEQNSENTEYYNGIGFNGIGFNGLDAGILTSMAKWYEGKGFLTPKQLEVAKRKLKKYAGQILRMMAADSEREVSHA